MPPPDAGVMGEVGEAVEHDGGILGGELGLSQGKGHGTHGSDQIILFPLGRGAVFRGRIGFHGDGKVEK